MSHRWRHNILPMDHRKQRKLTMTALIVYFSLSGMTRRVATALAKALAADIEDFSCRRYSSGIWGRIKAGFESWSGRLPVIEPLGHVPANYDLAVVGGPVWAFHAATPVRAFLRQEASRFKKVAFFVTHGGSGAQRSLWELALLADQEPTATLVVRGVDITTRRFGQAVSSFAAQLQKSAV